LKINELFQKIRKIIILNPWIHKKLRSCKKIWKLFINRKPSKLSWRDYWFILSVPIRYQPLVFPDGSIIIKKSSDTIPSSYTKLKALEFPNDFTGKTFLDIGCAEGFFVIMAAARNAIIARGCDIENERIKIARIVAKAWDFQDKVEFSVLKLYDILPDFASDIVTCLAVSHHLHGGNHDTWQIISNPKKYEKAFNNMLHVVSAVATLTKEKTYWEYSYEYNGEKPNQIDYKKLGRIWEENGLYRKVIFKGLSQCTNYKDRAIYHAYK
jgi:2-polyprenyl-3-methyl-5-hydroxy-6-metoxy-1,4-benzoquinol methylase